MAFDQNLPTPGTQLISVQLREERYAIDIMAVREIRGWTTSTPLAGAPSHVLGMINLRGAVLPVLDLGARLGLGSTPPGRSSVVVVVHVHGRMTGLLVDAVCDIVTVRENEVQAVPDVEGGCTGDFVQAILTTDEGIVSLLSLNGILPGPETNHDAPVGELAA